MKKILRSLIPMFLIATSALADNDTGKTFLMPRPQGVNLAMEYTTWHKLIQKYNKHRGGTALAATPFYQESCNREDVGKYFGLDHKNTINLDEASSEERDVNLKFIIHDVGETTARNAKMELSPSQQNFGVRLDLYQDLEELFKGAYAKIALPFVYVQNNVRLEIEEPNNEITGRILNNYFKGKYSLLNDAHDQANAQYALKKAKMDNARSKSGLADLDIILGYKFINKKRGYAALNLGLTIPTGNDVDGKYLFEPIYGNGGHWGLGCGFDSKIKFWRRNHSYFKFMLIVNYRYLFEGTEERTLGLLDSDENERPLGHYYLVGKNGDWAGRPAANILTRNLEVTPGSQLDGIAAFAYHNGGFIFDLGYNLFWKDSEETSLNGDWKSRYGIVSLNKSFTTALNTATDADWYGGSFDAAKIEKDNLDFSAATNSSYFTNKIYGGLGYVFKNWKNQVMIGTGGSYEFANNDQALENWAVWFKGGINF